MISLYQLSKNIYKLLSVAYEENELNEIKLTLFGKYKVHYRGFIVSSNFEECQTMEWTCSIIRNSGIDARNKLWLGYIINGEKEIEILIE